MILTPQSLQQFGFRVSADQDLQVALAIESAEMFSLKGSIGDALYHSIDTARQSDADQKYYNARKGGTFNGHTFAGIEKALAHLAYSNLLRDNLNATRFGAVKKTSDDSQLASSEDLREVAMYHATIYRHYLRDVCEYIGVEIESTNTYFYEWQ